MPRKNSIKTYIKNGYYHVYNRGVEKRTIFEDEQDYIVFLRFLKEYLLPLGHEGLIKLSEITPRRKPINCYNKVKLLAYCLMPNHFHLMIKQLPKDGLKIFMHTVCTNYSMYFNRKYNRIGPLYQGPYKAVLIMDEPYYLHITRYIHRNPLDLPSARARPLQYMREYPYSSYGYYLKGSGPDWLNVKPILSQFRTARSQFPKDILSYQAFVEKYKQNDKDKLERLALD